MVDCVENAGLNVYMQNPSIIRINGSVSKALYQYTLQDLDLEALYGAAACTRRSCAITMPRTGRCDAARGAGEDWPRQA